MYTYSPPQYPASTATCYLTTRLRAARFRAAAPRGDSNTTLRWRQGYCRSRVRPWLTPPHCVAASAQGAVLNSPASRNVLRTSTTYLPAKPERTLLERMADRLSGEVGWPHGDLSRAGTWKGRPPRRKITNDHRRVDPAAPGLGDGAATHLPRDHGGVAHHLSPPDHLGRRDRRRAGVRRKREVDAGRPHHRHGARAGATPRHRRAGLLARERRRGRCAPARRTAERDSSASRLLKKGYGR